MYCTRCGTRNEDGARFCTNCGTALTPPAPVEEAAPAVSEPAPAPVGEAAPAVSEPAPAPVVEPVAAPASAPVYQQPAPAPAKPLRSDNPAVNAIKNLGASPLFLAAAIAFSVAFFFTLIQNFSGFSMPAVLDTLTRNDFGLRSELYRAYSALSAAAVPMALISSVPNALIVAGLWMTYGAARSTRDGGMKTAGLNLIRASLIISVVLAGMVAVVVALCVIVSMIAGIVGDRAGWLVAIGIAFLAILVGVTLGILYEVKSIRLIDRVKGTLRTGVGDFRAPMFVVVFNFISASFSLFSLTNFSFASAVAVLSNAAALVMFSLLMLRFRSTRV